MHLLRAILFLTLCFIPISAESQITNDSTLLGTWIWHSENDSTIVLKRSTKKSKLNKKSLLLSPEKKAYLVANWPHCGMRTRRRLYKPRAGTWQLNESNSLTIEIDTLSSNIKMIYQITEYTEKRITMELISYEELESTE